MSGNDAAFFACNGYLQLPQAVDAGCCAHLVAETWRWLPEAWRPDDPDSWRGPVADSCHTAEIEHRRGHLKYQVKSLADDPHVVAAFQDPSPVHAVALALIGKPLHRIRLRGLYVIAPAGRAQPLRRFARPHVEAHPAQLVALCYLADVAPGGGGLLVWPGSHRPMYNAFESKLDFVAGADHARLMAKYSQREPVELAGRRGDVVLIHHRLLHAPGLNTSSDIRFGFLCDYTPLDYRALCRQAPGRDLWEDWPGLRARTTQAEREAAPDKVMKRLDPRPRPEAAAASAARTPSSQNKHDASVLARMKTPGAVWLSISDSGVQFEHTHSVDPQGSNITAAGVRAFLNGVKLASLSKGDITVRLSPRPGENLLSIRGVTGPLWIRVVLICLPFIDSVVLLRRATDGRQPKLDFRFVAPGSAGSTDSETASTLAAEHPTSSPLSGRGDPP